VVWDGTGLGEDGNIWGGEFFLYENNALRRQFHFDYFPLLLGDKMPKEPRLSALAICHELKDAGDMLQAKFTETEWQLYQKMLAKPQQLLCSAVGRIFDAVCSLLLGCDKQTYEGEAALLLETAAQQYLTENGYCMKEHYFMKVQDLDQIPTASLCSGIITDMNNGKTTPFIAAKFHYSLANLIKIIAEKLEINKIAFSGGVFQNSVLVDMIQHLLGKSHQLHFHENLSPNDENISFGQMTFWEMGIV
jgi:hydrogenase maturation protein HypF